MKQTFVVSLIVSAALIFATAANAADKSTIKKSSTAQTLAKKKHLAGRQLILQNNGTVNLTAAECTGLGGKVDANVHCPNQACFTVDPAGVIRKVCLSAAQ